MAKEKHYKVVGNTVFADMGHLTAQEIREIKGFVAIGFKVIHQDPPQQSKEEKEKEKETAAISCHYSEQKVKAFLEKIDKENNNTALMDEYKKLYSEQAGTNRKQTIIKEDGTKEVITRPNEPVFKMNGDPKPKGFINVLMWFKSLYKYDENTGDFVPREKEEKNKKPEETN